MGGLFMVKIDAKSIVTPHIMNLKYKGFHPIEKKKTIKKINLLIDKFNKVNRELSENGLEFVSEETGNPRFNSLLAQHGLETYASVLLQYNAALHTSSISALESMLKENKKHFKKWVYQLATSGKSISEINKEVENNEYWKYCDGKDAKSLKLNKNNDYNKLLSDFMANLKIKVQYKKAKTIYTIKVFLIDKENEKVEKITAFLDKLEKHINEKETELSTENRKNYNASEENDIKKLTLAFKRAKAIFKAKSGNFEKGEIDIIEKYLKEARIPQEIKTPNKPKYFLPMMKDSDKNTKKTLLKIMSAEIENGSYDNIVKTIDEYFKTFENTSSK